MAEFHLLYVLVQSWWGRHLCWEHLIGGSDNEQSSKNTLWKVGKCQSALQLICVRGERIYASFSAGTLLCFAFCTGTCLSLHMLLWAPALEVLDNSKPETRLVSHQKCWHDIYLELKQALLQYCYLTKNRLTGDLQHQAQIWIQIWNSLKDSSSLELGFWFCSFYRHADWYSCKHNLCLQTRDTKKWEQASSAEIGTPITQTYKVYTKPGLLVLRWTPEYSEY